MGFVHTVVITLVAFGLFVWFTDQGGAGTACEAKVMPRFYELPKAA